MDRVFLDANVLFSAAYDPDCRIATIWRLTNLQRLTSTSVTREAIRNIEAKAPKAAPALGKLLRACELVGPGDLRKIPPGVELVDHDRHVLAAAIGGHADYLLTGDKHFRPLFGRAVAGVTIMRPGDYLHRRSV